MSSYSLIPLPPAVTGEMLHASFWLGKISDPRHPLLPPQGIEEFNKSVHDSLGIPPVVDLPDTLSAAGVRAQIAQYQPPTKTRYGSDGAPLDATYFQTLIEKAAPPMSDPVSLRFGLVTQRTSVRSFPTDDVVTSEPLEFDLDRFQETAVDVGWPVAVAASTQDGQWFFCLTPLYWGWVHAEDIALGTRGQVRDFVSAEPFITTLVSRGMIALASGGGAIPQMGTRLPLHEDNSQAYRVKVPIRRQDGTLGMAAGFAPKRDEHFVRGCLPYTWETIFIQAFRLLGEPYAWGDSRMGMFGRDCSRLIRDIHAVTGIILPRNADQQEKVGTPVVTFEAEWPDAEREKRLVEQVQPGAMLAMRGHIMLYLGQVDGKPYVIHDTSSNGYSSIIVSDLSLGTNSPSGSLLHRLTSAVMIAPGSGKFWP
jgi:hypothetical protein